MTNLKRLYFYAIELYAKREDLFKKLGKEVYLNWIMDVKDTNIKEFDEEIKKLDLEIQVNDSNIKKLELQNEH